MRCMVIEVLPFNKVGELNLLLKMNKNESTDVINHRLVVYKHVKEEYDDRIGK